MPQQALIHIFQSGRQTTAAGDTLEFSDADLQAIATGYDPTKHEAPICVGHPKDDLPAYGWIGGMRAQVGDLYAAHRDVDPQFAAWRL